MGDKNITPLEYAKKLAEEIKSFREYDNDFQPLPEEIKAKYFKSEREPDWPVLKKAVFVVNRNGEVMLFYRPPLNADSKETSELKAPKSTYGLTSCNSIIVYGDYNKSFNEIVAQRIQGWPKNCKVIPIGMGHAIVSGYFYFFEVGYAIVPKDISLNIMGYPVTFVNLDDAILIMRSHGLEYKEMEINIAKTLCKKER